SSWMPGGSSRPKWSSMCGGSTRGGTSCNSMSSGYTTGLREYGLGHELCRIERQAAMHVGKGLFDRCRVLRIGKGAPAGFGKRRRGRVVLQQFRNDEVVRQH